MDFKGSNTKRKNKIDAALEAAHNPKPKAKAKAKSKAKRNYSSKGKTR